jgi:tetratricopeptide (TPR) repeat protein
MPRHWRERLQRLSGRLGRGTQQERRRYRLARARDLFRANRGRGFHHSVILVRLLALLVASALFSPATLRADADAARARALLLTGHYTDAQGFYERLAPREPIAAAIGIARCRDAVGALGDALRTLSALTEKHPEAAEAQAELARLEFERGNYDAAQRVVDAALRRDPDQPAARFMLAELHRVAGRLDQASDAYRWFIRFYNAEQDSLSDPDVLRWIGLAAAQYARWNRNSGQFHFLVNTLYPDALKRDSTYWLAHLEAARLFIEKYNRPDALDELKAALAINPNAAEAHAARAMIALQQFDLDSARAAVDRALAINPRLVLAHQLHADLLMLASGPRAAVPILERARALNPADEETLGRLAAAYGVIDGLRDSAGTRMAVVIAEAERRNAHCGAFFASLASSLNLMQRVPYAARYFEEARRRMPQLVAVPGQLGLVELQLGDEARARDILQEAFGADPFNVRVKNSLAVLDLLRDYGTIETEHFVVRFDRGRDSLLARYASRWLEEDVYREIVTTFGHAPQGRTLFEIFSTHGGTTGHGWFSARLVGLPFIGTVGGCAGRMVAMTSPDAGGLRFNWARVLKHEFVHIVNLSQTDFSIPRWFTEGLAVWNEGHGRPRQWGQILARRVAADSLFDLDTINLGFSRPSSGEDWALAYYQAELYARYMAERYGKDAPGRMIAAYADHLDTRAALQRCFGITQEAFEKGYRGHLRGIAGPAGERGPGAPGHAEDLATLERASAANSDDAHLLARLARAHLRSHRVGEARACGTRALGLDPREQLAACVLAQVVLSEGDKSRAVELLRGALDPNAPQLDALMLLTNLMLEAKGYAEVERLASLGDQRFPLDANWLAGLTVAYRETGQQDKLSAVLGRRAEGDASDPDIRMELARFAASQHDPETAGRWALEAIHIDVMNPEAHAILARALAQRSRHAQSIEEYGTAAALQPENLEWRLAEAKECVAMGMKTCARELLVEVLERNPHHLEARQLLETLGH